MAETLEIEHVWVTTFNLGNSNSEFSQIGALVKTSGGVIEQLRLEHRFEGSGSKLRARALCAKIRAKGRLDLAHWGV